MAQWVTSLPTQMAADPLVTFAGGNRLRQAVTTLRGGNGHSPATISSVVVTTIATFFVLLMLRPPIVTKQNHPHESPRVNISIVVAWSLAAGVASLVLSVL